MTIERSYSFFVTVLEVMIKYRSPINKIPQKPRRDGQRAARVCKKAAPEEAACSSF